LRLALIRLFISGLSDPINTHKRYSVKTPIELLQRLAVEPPFRLFTKHILALLPCSLATRAKWDLSARPQYLVATLFAAHQARAERIPEISVIEYGVAGGNGLVALQEEAQAVEQATGIAIRVYGFDAGPGGLPNFCGDYRDHPDIWRPGDYPMDVKSLEARLAPRTKLILGDIRERIERFREEFDPSPIGFMAVDVDLYSSAAAALRALDLCPILQHVPLYFDDIDLDGCHRWAGELLAIDEFNEKHADRKIDRWRGLKNKRPFPELAWIDRMFICHDLQSITRCTSDRAALELNL
jgi:hypothetical protein